MPKRRAADSLYVEHHELDDDRAAFGPRAAWNSFWFAARDRIALDALRVLLGLYLLVWLGSCIGHQRAPE